MNLVKGKDREGNNGKGKGKTEQGKGQDDERKCFYCDGKGHIKSNFRQKVTDDKKSESKSSSSTDKVTSATIVATAQEHEPSDELWIFAVAVGGSRGSGNEAPGDIVELVVDIGTALPTSPPCIEADAPSSQELSPRKLVGTTRRARQY